MLGTTKTATATKIMYPTCSIFKQNTFERVLNILYKYML
jgi:hypothetical protein